MTGFDYYAPTRVVFGEGAEQKTGALAKQAGATRVLLHHGMGHAEKSGLLAAVRQSLAEAGLAVVELPGVRPNPHLDLVNEGIALCRREGVDFLLAVGGGSVIDSAKAIGYGLADKEEGDVWDFFCGKRKPRGNVPIGAVLTIAAAGSEMSNSSVITNAGTGEKKSFNHNALGRIKFAVMNPALTLSVPPFQTAAGCADIMMHTMERYFTPEKETMALTDGIAEELLRNVMANANALAREPKNLAARTEVMWAGSLSHNGLTGCGSGAGDWACHALAHEFSAKYDMTHGAALTAVWGAWARYVYKQDAARFARFAQNVLGLDEVEDAEEAALEGIGELESFFWGLGLPTRLSEAGLEPTDADLDEMARRCSQGGERRIGGFMKLDEKDMRAIFAAAR